MKIITARVRELALQTENFKSVGNNNPSKKARSFNRMQQALIAAQELGDEKMNLLQAILDKIEIKTRLLDQDFKNLGKYSKVLSIINLNFLTLIDKINILFLI